MKILVVGGFGFIGSHVTEKFLKTDNEIYVFDNLSSPARIIKGDNVSHIKGDIKNL